MGTKTFPHKDENLEYRTHTHTESAHLFHLNSQINPSALDTATSFFQPCISANLY